MTVSNSFLRWAGSKKKLLPVLKPYWGDGFARYIEPFMGSGQLFFSINPTSALISDLNYELVEVYNQIKRNPYPVYQILKTFKLTEKEYYKVRSVNPSLLGINQRAARFIYLNRLCFNGLYRTNTKGEFNVPYCKSAPEIILDYDSLKIVSKKLKFATIKHGDFEAIISENIKANDFVYLDPPYAVSNRRIFKQYGPQTFGLEDLKRLKKTLKLIESKKAKFLLSYASCPEFIDLFSDWPIRKTYTQRNISGFAQHRRKAAELLVSNIAIDD